MTEVTLAPNLTLRPIEPTDHAAHLALMHRIYPPAFAYLWPDAGKWYVEHTHRREALLTDLADPDCPYYHVYYRNQLSGIFRLRLRNECPDFPGEPALLLHRLYLDDGVRGHGVGTRIVDYAKAETARLGRSLLWLERMDTNEATIGFYRKNGFRDGGAFRLTFELMPERFRGMFRMWWRVG